MKIYTDTGSHKFPSNSRKRMAKTDAYTVCVHVYVCIARVDIPRDKGMSRSIFDNRL